MDEFFDKVADLVAPERLGEFAELKRAFRGSRSQRQVAKALGFAADKTAQVVVELETAKDRITGLLEERARLTAALDASEEEVRRLTQKSQELEAELDKERRENAADAPRRAHLGPEQPGQAQVLLLQVEDLTRRHAEAVERSASARAQVEALERQVKHLEDDARRASVQHAEALEAAKEATRETRRLLNTAGSMRHLDFLPVVRGRSYKEVTLNAYLQFIRKHEQLYREKCSTYLSMGTANQMYDNACIGALSLVTNEWVTQYFVDPLAPHSMVHHFDEFVHYRIVLSNATGLFAELITVVQLNSVAVEQHKKVSATELRSLANLAREPVRQFRAAIEIHSRAFQQYLDVFVEYVKAERAAVKTSGLRSAQYGPLENRFVANVRGAQIEEDRNATAAKRRRVAVDDLLQLYGALPSSQPSQRLASGLGSSITGLSLPSSSITGLSLPSSSITGLSLPSTPRTASTPMASSPRLAAAAHGRSPAAPSGGLFGR